MACIMMFTSQKADVATHPLHKSLCAHCGPSPAAAKPWEEVCPRLDPDGRDLVRRMLAYDPAERCVSLLLVKLDGPVPPPSMWVVRDGSTKLQISTSPCLLPRVRLR